MADEKPKEKVQTIKFSLEIELIDKFQFKVKFDYPEIPELITDEPISMGGEGKGPNPSRMVGTAVANCLSSSLIHCLRRAKADVRTIRTDVNGLMERNDEGMLRLTKIDVTLHPTLGSSNDQKAFERCLKIFEKYCIVTESIRNGILVNVGVEPEYKD